MTNSKNKNGDSKNKNTDSKNNNADSKNTNAESKNNAVDSKNKNADPKENAEVKSNSENKNGDSKYKKADSKKKNPDSKDNNSDSKTNADAPSQGDVGGGNLPLSPGAVKRLESQRSRNDTKVYKSGPLFLSSKGIGWTSWKKRWFILTETSLVFFRNDPNTASQKGNEANLTLGGIDLNNSGSVVVKADKKLLTVLFPDGRDGRAFTLKAETSEDLMEWKEALEEALVNAPSACLFNGQNGILKNEKGEAIDGSQEQSAKDKSPKSVVMGRPILLALEDIDGTPSFLEKAIRYVEDHGVKVEGILRQAADVDDVERRIREYEQGKTEFTAEEDGHVIGDCIKYVLRELPSSPVPASCCKALLDAFRTDRATRVSAMRTAICDTFPEPNRRLLQRILIMMEIVAENKAVNRMSISAVAACMAPLLLRPLLAGECEIENEFDMGGDGSVQLLQAAAAANHAQAIVITLLEEYDKIFGEGDMLNDLYSDTEESGSESEELSDDETYEDDDYEDEEYTSEGSHADEDLEHASSVTCSENGDDGDSSQHHSKGSGSFSSSPVSNEAIDDPEASEKLTSSSPVCSPCQHDKLEVGDDVSNKCNDHSTLQADEHVERSEDGSIQLTTSRELNDNTRKPPTVANGSVRTTTRPIRRTGAKKNLSMDNIDFITEEEAEVLRLEATKAELKENFELEARENSILKQDVMSKKNALEERRLALEQEVARLQEQLQKERELRKKLEAGLRTSQAALPLSPSSNEKTTDDHGIQLNQPHDSWNQPPPSLNQGKVKDKEKDRDSHRSKDEKHQFHSFSSKLPPSQQLDPSRTSKVEMSKSASAVSKRSNSRSESANPNFALSKISNGINFLKEKSNQIAHELQTLDKERIKGQSSQKKSQKGSESPQSLDSYESDGKTSEDQSVNHTNLERGKSENYPMEKPREGVHPRTYSR